MIEKENVPVLDCSQDFLCHQLFNYCQGDLGNAQAMSFEDILSQESTLPPVETVLPQLYAITPPTPPSSVPPIPPSTSPQFQQEDATTTTPQHNHNIMIEHQHNQYQPRQPQPQQVATVHYHPNSNYDYNPSRFSHAKTKVESNNENDAEVTYISDVSTVDGEEFVPDEPFTYLQNLNSENLMKFSQQSQILQLMEEQVCDAKANSSSIPTCEEHDHGGYDFRIQINCTEPHAQRRGVIYSKETQRLYMKTNENVYIDCSYKVKMPVQPLHVRVFAVYSTDTSDPVLRCQNHISKDTEADEVIRNSLVRCENPDATYYGCDTGKCISDRYSVLVPLNSTTKAGDNHLKQQLIVNFTCNNSCMSRKPTSAIFLLENMKGDILAQRILSVKISTCPKRDRRLYEGPKGNFNKRRANVEPDFCPTEPKMSKYDQSCIKDEFSRSSYDPSDDDGGSANVNGDSTSDCVDVHQETESGDFVLTLKYKTRQQILQVLRVLYSNAITNEVFFKPNVNGKKKRDSEYLKRGYEKAMRLKGRMNHIEFP